MSVFAVCVNAAIVLCAHAVVEEHDLKFGNEFSCW